MFFDHSSHIPKRFGFRLCFVCLALIAFISLLYVRSGEHVVAAVVHKTSLLQQYVAIDGDVQYPGVYEFNANDMANSVIKMAKPRHPMSDIEYGRLASLSLENGTLLTLVYGNGENLVKSNMMPVAQCLVLNIPLHISRMNSSDFELLPSIGPVMAERIMQYSQKNGGLLKVDELQNIEGIGENRFKLLKKYFK